MGDVNAEEESNVIIWQCVGYFKRGEGEQEIGLWALMHCYLSVLKQELNRRLSFFFKEQRLPATAPFR